MTILCVAMIFFGISSIILMLMVDIKAERRITPRVKRSRPEEKGAERVSWRDIDDPLLLGWERRFRASIGPIPENIGALNDMAKHHFSMASGYREQMRGTLVSYHTSSEFDRMSEQDRLGQEYRNLYEQEVRKFYLLGPSDEIHLPPVPDIPPPGRPNRVRI